MLIRNLHFPQVNKMLFQENPARGAPDPPPPPPPPPPPSSSSGESGNSTPTEPQKRLFVIQDKQPGSDKTYILAANSAEHKDKWIVSIRVIETVGYVILQKKDKHGGKRRK